MRDRDGRHGSTQIEPAEGVGGPPHDAAGEIVLAQIADEAERPPARCSDLTDDRVDTCLIDVDYADRRAFAGKPNRPRPGPSRTPQL